MVCMQLSPKKYYYFTHQLVKKARNEPLDASYHVPVTVNDREYLLKIQPEKKRRLYALQALQIDRDDECVLHTLITRNNLLAALLTILVEQGI